MIVINKTMSAKIFNGINYVILAVLTASCLYPLWYTLCLSLSNKAAVNSGQVTLFPIGPNLTSYKQIMGDLLFINSFWISIMRTSIGTVLSLMVLILMAYPLSKNKSEYSLRNTLMWIVVFCMVFSGGVVPWFIIMQRYHLTNSILGLVLAGGLPVFNLILIMNFFRNLPKDMEEAAIVDGAGPWSILFRIVVPCSFPVLATIALFTSVHHWNEFFQGLILSSGQQHYPLQTYIQQMVVTIPSTQMTPEMLQRMEQLSNRSLDAAKVFIALIPMLCVYPFLQKYFITGIMLGSSKE
jgi:multiple sugar transport system permease protein/putative aldouronate transport system permease protein